ncbi:MAG TPA: GFA family protein [Casimicrobiaceae bacterium]|nr:GFA family protein [Casimicrobiaceae bacterium]
MSAETSHPGRCFCGAVEFTVTGAPIAMGYCHCDSCRHWSAGPVNAFTLWPSGQFKLTRGAEHVGTYAHTAKTERSWCKQCGGHVYARHPGANLVDVFAAMLPSLAFKPAVHVHYQESVLPIRDGLPKMKDMPKEFGGSGEVLAE